MIGAGRVAVTRAFDRLKKAGAVEQRSRHIHVPDLEALKRAAETGPPPPPQDHAAGEGSE